MIRLIASDIDGTLLQDGAGCIAPAMFREITRLRAKGIRFCPASGRQYHSLRRLFAPVADELVYVCENGAVIFGPGNPGPVLGKTSMERPLALRLCHEILDTPQCEVLISGANTSYLCPKEMDIVDHIGCFVGNNLAVVGIPEEVPEDIVKVSAYCRMGAVQMEPVLVPRWKKYFRAALAGEKWLDFTLADKGGGLCRLCAALGIGMDEVMAFGDNYNDLPMLDLVGEPYIMENAAPELRRRFPNHCRRVEAVLGEL
ncbi:MAG: HAD family hydrolase [Lawsonibacter sp.]